MAWVVRRDGARGTTFNGVYRDPDGVQRSAGTFPSRRAAERADRREEAKVLEGEWHDVRRGAITFTDYVQSVWLPCQHQRLASQCAVAGVALGPLGADFTNGSTPTRVEVNGPRSLRPLRGHRAGQRAS